MSTQVYLLTEQQKNILTGQPYAPDSLPWNEMYFTPILDADGNWVVPQEEADLCVIPEFQWVKELPLIPYNPAPPIPPGPTGATGENN